MHHARDSTTKPQMKQNESLAHRQSYIKGKRQEELINENAQMSVQNKGVNEKIEVNQMDRFRISKLSEKKQAIDWKKIFYSSFNSDKNF